MELSKDALRKLRALRQQHEQSSEKEKNASHDPDNVAECQKESKNIVKDPEKRAETAGDVGWMYKSAKDNINKEDYLLGKRIGKEIEDDFKEEEREIERVVPVDEDEPEKSQAITVDMAAKIREDPLYQIKKMEEKNKRDLLRNPVKMKQLKEIVESQKSKSEKKKKKKKKHKRSRSSSDSDDSGGEDLLARYQQVLANMRNRKKRKSGDGEEEPDSEGGGGRQPRGPHLPGNPSLKAYEDGEDYDSDEDARRNRKKGYGLYVPEGAVPRKADRDVSRTSEPKKDRPQPHKRRDPDSVKRLDAGEKERRLRQMMEDARERDLERETRFERHKREAEREERDLQSRRGRPAGSSFTRPLVTAGKGSVEDSIKRRMNNVQRTSADLDKKFTKR